MTDMAAAYGMAGWPFAAVIGALFVIVLARSHLLYWLGRGVFSGAGRLADRVDHPTVQPTDQPPQPGRLHVLRAHSQRLMTTPTARRALALIHRWGPLAVTFAYVTVGIQTAIFVGSGLVRMPYPRFVVASIPGSIAWAFIWGTVGLGAVWAAAQLALASPWALVGVLVLLVAAVAGVVTVRRRRAANAVTAPN
ncbi:DedA family protein [Cellulomonas taurus]|uniref:DedA family protein n=1 Tax=Cellulomonas taurus TaxID=2729175 RepID=UPI00145FA820|nr:VTT domain-containing protein [Cellulomonas taurus]